MIIEYFWLIGGLFVGIFGTLFGKLKSKEFVTSGQMTNEEVNEFLKGYAISIMAPALIFWIIQTSIGTTTGADFLSWPNPQKSIAVTLLVVLWALLLSWVLYFKGAKKLVKFLPLLGNFPNFMIKEKSIKIGVVLIVFSGIASLSLQHV